MYLISAVIFFLCLFLLLSVKVRFKINVKLDDNKFEVVPLLNMDNYITIKLSFIPVYKHKLFNSNKRKKENKKEKSVNKLYIVNNFLKIIKVKKILFNLGFNLDDPIANSNLNAFFNMVLCIVINKYQTKFDLKKLYYSTYISTKTFILNLDSIISANLADIIYVFIKTIIDERRKQNGRTSNRKFNGNSNEFAKRYDRC